MSKPASRASVRTPFARAAKTAPPADIKKPSADVKKPSADVKKPSADIKKPSVAVDKRRSG